VELLTRIATQPLARGAGTEKAALDSVHSLFACTRGVLKQHGRDCADFAKIAVVVLNQVVRPFTAKWHRLSEDGAFADPTACAEFRKELAVLQGRLRSYTETLAEMAGVEDLTQVRAAD
jgi:hypothetical protein